jgi:predicted dehydrogenase
VTVDDAATAIGCFKNGALFNLEATRFAPGRKNSITLEINGSAGSIFFDLEEMNRLKFFSRRDPKNRQGFRDIIVTEPEHPYMKNWWPPGHIIGYEHTFVHTVADFVQALVSRKLVQPDFADALRTQHVLDAARRSTDNNKWIEIT